MPPVLLSRGLDPLLGIFTGVFAYYLYESHPRSAIEPEDKLNAVIAWRWKKWQREREQVLSPEEDVDLAALIGQAGK
ncbi:uncharacterized protein LAESUDRAFT_646231 [Laetiporus sulphureus 93-53]|uniref:Uncharacterized protein n=1 Tax=Laetiporus sulphureus 93-53 TaxID=1314785 RepID=A0A165FWU2_9APHY|nr:uncharacterized protein LAESUDRAFT_646231 [Laetiporus sulphureus 93-53]KZT09516.1 hypothetical protein LAESUDRAFT_646231 [Laetiporus sulphureus 93-53]